MNHTYYSDTTNNQFDILNKLFDLYKAKNYLELYEVINKKFIKNKLIDTNGNTILHHAINNYDSNIIDHIAFFVMLINNKCLKKIINNQNKFGDTVLHNAVRMGYDDLADLLIINEIDTKIRNNDNKFVNRIDSEKSINMEEDTLDQEQTSCLITIRNVKIQMTSENMRHISFNYLISHIYEHIYDAALIGKTEIVQIID